MKRSWLHVLALAPALSGLAACDPPALPDELLPRIEIVAPVSDSEVPLTASATGCDLDVIVAVDLDNFELVPVGTPVADGEGHWHIIVVGRETDSLAVVQNSQSAAYHVANLTSGTRIALDASLHNSEHDPIEGPGTSSQVEVDLVDPADGGVLCQ
jgi:hypothetical protein